MFQLFTRTGSALALVLAFGLSASAQVPQPTNGQGFRVKELIGSTIGLQSGTSAGTIEDLVANADGVIEYLVINNNGKLVTVPWDAAKFNWPATNPAPSATTTTPAGSVVVGQSARPTIAVLSISPQQYQAIPTYSATTYPSFYNPTYRTEIYKAYGLTPGQERRIERRIERR